MGKFADAGVRTSGYTDVPTSAPGDDEVLVKADTVGVSMPEVLVRRGAYGDRYRRM